MYIYIYILLINLEIKKMYLQKEKNPKLMQ
jgi:hypothetical protein